MGGIPLKALAGAAGGLLAWLLWEPSSPIPDTAAWTNWELRFTLTLAVLIGLFVGGVNGWSKGSRLHLVREAALGAVFGAIGGSLGKSLGAELCTMLSLSPGAIQPLPTAIAARVIALTPFGLCIGAGVGAATLSVRGVIQGAIGGFLAGAVAGALFDPIGNAVGQSIIAASNPHGQNIETGGPSRAVFAVLIGLTIGLFIGIAERVMRSAWVRLSLGRNEGKEWVIDRPQTLIGRSEGAQIPIFGDPSVAPAHAYILARGGAYTLADAGSPAGVFLNGQRIAQAPLQHGAHIQVGQTVLEFLMRAGAAPARGPEAYSGPYPVGGLRPPQAPAQGAGPGPIPSPAQATVASPAPLQPLAPGGFSLLATDGPLAGRRFPVLGLVELGRESAAVPMSYDSQASRRHATASPSALGIEIADAGSTNGTFLNGRRVSSATARVGDMLRIGQTTFRVEAG